MNSDMSRKLLNFSIIIRQFATKQHKIRPDCIIDCKNTKLNHYKTTIYKKFEQIPLASKGWAHYKSKGDYFNVIQQPVTYEMIPLENTDISNSILIDNLKNHFNIRNLTQYQLDAIEMFKRDCHLMIAAETGCGKTLCYLIPIIENLLEQHDVEDELNTPKVVIIVPNRELAYQIGDTAQKLVENLNLNVGIIVGGRTKKLMWNPEFKNLDILIGTPGALGKLATIGIYRLNKVKYTILDEADTLIDDSFVERMNGIVKRLPQSKFVLVSATLPKTLPPILQSIENNLKQCISTKLHKPLLNIQQRFLRLSKSSKPSNLLQIAKNNKQPLLIFTNRNETCNWLAMFLRENGVDCSNINGDMNYLIRIEQWNNFINGRTQILSCTDVGSRGLDTIHVRHILNYDFPLYAADYLHRIGRVGRLSSDENCKATNFIAGPQEVNLVQQIEMAIRCDQPLNNVDGNITNLVQRKIERRMQQVA